MIFWRLLEAERSRYTLTIVGAPYGPPNDSHLVHRVCPWVYLESRHTARARAPLLRTEERHSDAAGRRAKTQGNIVSRNLDAINLPLLHEHPDRLKAADGQIYVDEQHVYLAGARGVGHSGKGCIGLSSNCWSKAEQEPHGYDGWS
jgi:hypothetical protein